MFFTYLELKNIDLNKFDGTHKGANWLIFNLLVPENKVHIYTYAFLLLSVIFILAAIYTLYKLITVKYEK